MKLIPERHCEKSWDIFPSFFPVCVLNIALFSVICMMQNVQYMFNLQIQLTPSGPRDKTNFISSKYIFQYIFKEFHSE